MAEKKRPLSQRKTSKSGILIWILESVVVSGLVAWLAYDRIWGMVWFPVFLVMDWRRRKADRQETQREEFLGQFRELMETVAGALSAGYSVENAFAGAPGELDGLMSEDSLVMKGLRQINRQLQIHVPVEQAFAEAAGQIPYEEMQEFASTLAFAKRLGGDYRKNILRLTGRIQRKMETEQEIATMVAEKKLEFRVMLIMPLGILLYIRLTSGDYLNVMYTTPLGIGVMSFCILGYLVVLVLGRRIIRIEI